MCKWCCGLAWRCGRGTGLVVLWCMWCFLGTHVSNTILKSARDPSFQVRTEEACGKTLVWAQHSSPMMLRQDGSTLHSGGFRNMYAVVLDAAVEEGGAEVVVETSGNTHRCETASKRMMCTWMWSSSVRWSRWEVRSGHIQNATLRFNDGGTPKRWVPIKT